MYLTFDDGPDPTWTPKILDTLAAYGAKATFFAQGTRISAYPEIAARVAAEGHSLQNHSWTHANFTKLSYDSIVNNQLANTNAAIASVSGRTPTCVRPPYGATNATANAAITDSGMQSVMWTVDTRDYTKPGAGVIANTVMTNARPGSIILMHDAGGDTRQQTVDALGSVLKQLSAQGYTFSAACT